MRIRTTFDPKPIPDRRFDWCALDEDTYDGAEDSRTRHELGWGRTEREAVIDLLDRIDERDEPVTYDDRELRARELRGVEPMP